MTKENDTEITGLPYLRCRHKGCKGDVSHSQTISPDGRKSGTIECHACGSVLSGPLYSRAAAIAEWTEDYGLVEPEEEVEEEEVKHEKCQCDTCQIYSPAFTELKKYAKQEHMDAVRHLYDAWEYGEMKLADAREEIRVLKRVDPETGLAPCPFCDSPAYAFVHQEMEEDDPWATVRCTNPDCEAELCNPGDKDKTIEKWNARHKE